MRAVETVISAWIAEQERDRVRRRLESEALGDGPGAPGGEMERETAPQDLNGVRPRLGS
jgi:hypothetical protein